MSGDHIHCSKHSDILAVVEVGEFRHPVCEECYNEIVNQRKLNYLAQIGVAKADWGGD